MLPHALLAAGNRSQGRSDQFVGRGLIEREAELLKSNVPTAKYHRLISRAVILCTSFASCLCA
jgi:hypothetical protein